MSTYSDIYDRMYAELSDPSSKAEGSFSTDNIAAVAVELARIQEMGIDYMPHRFFPTLATGDDLTLAASNFGVDRKAAVAANVILTIVGTPGTYSGIKAAAGEVIFDLHEFTIPSGGSIAVEAACETVGATGNAPATTINEFVTTYAGLDSVTNASAASGGADEESDEDLLIRVKARWQTPSTGGNEGDYIRWALAVPGVSRVKIKSPSPGLISVYVVGSGNTTPGTELLADVLAAIELVRPLGPEVTTHSGEAVTADVTATVVLRDGYALIQVQTAIEERLNEYFAGLAFAGTAISYAKLADLLFADGVDDVESYTLNEGVSSISLTDTQFVQAGVISVVEG
jgi:uncharacterized phage protein gp47/JayE